MSVALDNDDLRLGHEQAEANPADHRIVVQFAVGRDVFDWFFNARTGYRAHFRAHYTSGLAFNDFIVDVLRQKLDERLPTKNAVRQLRNQFEDFGEASIDRDFIASSLEPSHSKVWFCGKRIQRGGGTECLVPSLSGPKILLNHGESWAAVYQENAGAWLDVKGVFVGAKCKYQIKDPIRRALKLQRDGNA